MNDPSFFSHQHEHRATRLFVKCLATNIGVVNEFLGLPTEMPKNPNEPLFLVLSYAGQDYTEVTPGVNNAFPIISQLIEGISFLKDVVGVSHHDLKPPNVMYREDLNQVQFPNFCQEPEFLTMYSM